MSNSEDHRLKGDGLLEKYWVDGLVEDLNDAVSEYRLALTSTAADSDDRLRAQLALANSLRIQFEEGLAGQEQFLESLALAERTVEKARLSSHLHLEARLTLSEVLLRPGRPIDEEFLNRVINTTRDLVDTLSAMHSPMLLKALCIQASALAKRCLLIPDKDAPTEANSVVDRALQLAEGNVVLLPELARALIDARSRRFAVCEKWEDVVQAIEVSQQLISSVPPSHPRLYIFFNNLGYCYGQQLAHRGEPDTFDRVVSAYAEAAARVPHHSSGWHIMRGNYADILGRRFRERSNLADLDEALETSRTVVRHINERSRTERPLFADVYVAALGERLEESYAQYGRLEFLDEAVTVHLQNVEVTPAVRQSYVLGNLAKSYMTRFLAHGRLSDLENSIALSRTAISACVTDRQTGASTYMLASCLLAMYEEREDAKDLEEGICLLRQNLSSSDPNLRPSSYSLLGHALLRRFICDGNSQDITESVECQRKAIELLAAGHLALPTAYARLAMAEYQLALIQRNISYAHASLAGINSALSRLPDHHPDRGSYLRSRAGTELLLAELEGQAYLEDALESLRKASSHEESWTKDRYTAAMEWAKVALESDRPQEAIDAYRVAIYMLPRLAWVGLEETLRMQQLSRLASDLAQDAVACAITLGEYHLAVELSEAARSVLWNAGQELRADLSQLREEAPELATELADVSSALEFQPVPTGDRQDPKDKNSESEAERLRKHRLASRRTELLALIRARSGFEHFQRPPTYMELSKVASDGPVIIINSSKYRCDALVLRADCPISHIPLPGLKYDQILQDVWVLQRCLQLVKDAGGRRFLELRLLDILRRLWATVGEPLCDFLFEGRGSKDLARVWWCPIGPLSFLPLHACGPHDGVHVDMFDRVISSYTPTLSALLRAKRENAATSFQSALSPRMLVICQPDIPGHAPLPCALDELLLIKGIFPSQPTAVVGSNGTVARVEELLPTHSWLHVSTHGTQNVFNPLESHLALHDGPLTLARLARIRLPSAEFVFLSACHSAKGNHGVPNESMHLAGGLMFAGYKSVVATMWGIADKDVPTVVRMFYARLVRKADPVRGRDTAEALHVATKALRERGVPAFRWVPFIHMGA